MSRFLHPLPALLVCLLTPSLVNAHGLLTTPPQRGALTPFNKFNRYGQFPAAPADLKAHFPAGDKGNAPGDAVRSQIRVAGPDGWNSFLPLKQGFKWRAGVCGDEVGKTQHHMRGGYYYFGGQITRNYVQGQVIETEINIIAHHNGFVELHICDVAKCGGEISEKCFTNGHCWQLQRAPNPACDSGKNKRCGPIDPAYPGRWYLPCTTVPENTQERMGNETMKYQLPKDLVCEHCVLHWFWSAANTCNPPGVIDYYEGPNGPTTWGDCFGQGGAKGGYTKVQKDCSTTRFPEEYYQCADVAIRPAPGSPSSPAPSEDPSPSPNMPTMTPVPSASMVSDVTPSPEAPATVTPVPSASGPVEASPNPDAVMPHSSASPHHSPLPDDGLFKEFLLVADGQVVQPLPDGCVVDIRPYKKVAIEAETYRNAAGPVRFSIDGKVEWTDYQKPYFLYGNKKRTPNYWTTPIVNKFFDLRADGDGESMNARIYLIQ